MAKPQVARDNDPVNPLAVKSIRPDTPEMESFLGAGYGGMTVDEAEAIIKERKENPLTHPYERMLLAQAFLAAYHARPIAISTDPGWKRSRPSS